MCAQCATPTNNKNQPYMDVIQTTKICELDLEKQRKFCIAELLSQNISKVTERTESYGRNETKQGKPLALSLYCVTARIFLN